MKPEVLRFRTAFEAALTYVGVGSIVTWSEYEHNADPEWSQSPTGRDYTFHIVLQTQGDGYIELAIETALIWDFDDAMLELEFCRRIMGEINS